MRTLLVPLVLLLIVSCDSSPIEPLELTTLDGTALFDSLQVTLTRMNFSWVPEEGPVPPQEDAVVTLEISVTCFALGACTLDASEFRYRTWDGLPPFGTAVWSPEPLGRMPQIESLTLASGATVQRWLSFSVPKGESYLPDVLLWTPDPRVRFAFNAYLSSGSLVCGSARVFGRVTDSSASPVAAAPIELSFYNLDRPENEFEDGECRGEVTFTESTMTDSDGRFEVEQAFRFCSERCVDLSASGPEGSGLGSTRVTGGTFWPSPLHTLVEPSSLRIDAVLPGD